VTVRPSRRQRVRGFTLTEVSIAMVVIGLGILALLHSMVAGTRVNAAGRDLTRATFLAQEVREMTLALPWLDPQTPHIFGTDGIPAEQFVDDLNDFLGADDEGAVTWSPPWDSNKDPLTDMDGWSQTIVIEWVDPNDLSTPVADGASDVMRFTVTVAHDGDAVTRASWLRWRREDE